MCIYELCMSSCCDNCELVLACSGFEHLALCCLQTDVLRHWSRTNALEYISSHHEMSGYKVNSKIKRANNLKQTLL
jgi:hypothetical protein